jgi:hypothetical protein
MENYIGGRIRRAFKNRRHWRSIEYRFQVPEKSLRNTIFKYSFPIE